MTRAIEDEEGSSEAAGVRRARESMNEKSKKAGQVVVVHDDEATRCIVTGYLAGQNMPASAASNRRELNRHFTSAEPSLIILDAQFGGDGLNLLTEIRSHSDVPIIIVTDRLINEFDRIAGFELGADDYIVKPLDLKELVARVRAILRRQELSRLARERRPQRGGYRFGGWQLEWRNRRLLDPQGESVALSKGEFALLLAFLKSPRRPLTREYLLQASRLHEDVFDRCVDVQVLRLRRKLERDPHAPRIIQTKRGVGYTFAVPVEPY